MKIKSLAATNFKGGTFKQNLDPVTVLWGKNWCGKSSILQAARIALAGCDASVGRTNADTFSFATAGAKQMGVAITFDNGETVSRSWTMARGSVSAAKPELPEIIKNIPPVLFDIQEYFKKSKADRVRYVLDLGAVELDPELLTTCIKTIKVAEPTERTVELVKDTADEVQAWLEDNISKPPVAMLDLLGKRFADKRDEAKAVIDTMQSADTAAMTVTAGAVPQNVSTELEKARQTLENLRVAQRLAQQWPARKKAVLDAEGELGTINSDIKRLKDQDFEAQFEAIKAKRHAVDSDISRQANANDALLARVDMAMGNLDKEIARYDVQLGNVNSATCEHCGAKLSDARREKMRDAIMENRAKAVAELDARAVEKKTLTNKALGLKSRLNEEERKAKANAELQPEYDRIVGGMATLKAAMDSVHGATQRVLRAREALAECADNDKPVDDAVVAKAAEAVDKLQEQQRVYEGYVAQKNQMEKYRERRDTAMAEFAVYRETVRVVADYSGLLAQKVFDGLMKNVNEVVEGVLKAPVCFNDGEFCMQAAGGGVTHWTFTASEKLVAYAGITLALAIKSPFKIVLLDEMQSLDEPNRANLVHRMQRLVHDGVIDQFIGAETTRKAPDFYNKGVKVINIG